MNKKKNAICLWLIAGVAVCAILSCTQKPAGKFAKKKCVECHQDAWVTFDENKVVHLPVAEGKCEECHRPHGVIGGVYLKQDRKKLCYTCHKESLAMVKQKYVHGPVQDEECVSCHNPHASMNKDLLREKEDDLCFACHAKGPFERKTTHAALKKECVFCHNAHSSDYENLLFAPANEVCEKCHDFRKNAFIKKHAGYDVADASCVSCHTPHSSSNDRLLREFIHTPTARMECNACHEPGDTSQIAEKGAGLCYKCHAKNKKSFTQKHIHLPVRRGSCLDCHSPHATDNKGVTLLPDGEMCYECHEK
ncbi:MAG: hypothetical protein IMF13_05450, partial [Proteobacteria bacterium]|nr:hypothetical protein [Pseudomonadota bacterium]